MANKLQKWLGLGRQKAAKSPAMIESNALKVFFPFGYQQTSDEDDTEKYIEHGYQINPTVNAIVNMVAKECRYG